MFYYLYGKNKFALFKISWWTFFFYVKSSFIYIICCLYFKGFLMIYIHKWKMHLVKFVHLELYFVLLLLPQMNYDIELQYVTYPVKGEASDKFSTHWGCLSLPHHLGATRIVILCILPQRLCGTQVRKTLPHISILWFNFPKSFLCRVIGTLLLVKLDKFVLLHVSCSMWVAVTQWVKSGSRVYHF